MVQELSKQHMSIVKVEHPKPIDVEEPVNDIDVFNGTNFYVNHFWLT